MKTYLGDGVYAEYDGYYVVLRAEHEGGRDIIYIEPPVLDALNLFYKKCTEEKEKEQWHIFQTDAKEPTIKSSIA